MKVELRVKLTSPMLGAQVSADRIRKMDCPPEFNGNIRVDIPRWHWAIQEAATALHLDEVDIHAIRLEKSYKCPTLVIHRRDFKKGSEKKMEMFESIRKGAELTFNMLLVQSPDPTGPRTSIKRRPPTIEELGSIFQLIGDTLGISPWGAQYGYGRFDVLSVREV